MPTCNICGGNKTLDELQGSFRYVCKRCWAKLRIVYLNDFNSRIEVDKDLIY